MGDVYHNRAEFVVTSWGVYYDRALYIDYLPDLYPYYAGLYLPITENASEKIDLFLIFSPFAEIMWITILIATLGVAFFKISLLKFHASLKATDVVSFLWTSFIAFFGGKPTPTAIDSKRSYKAVVFTSLLAGVVMWIAYRSYLSAALAISFKSYPFTDMESLSKTDWKYVLLQMKNSAFLIIDYVHSDYSPLENLPELVKHLPLVSKVLLSTKFTRTIWRMTHLARIQYR